MTSGLCNPEYYRGTFLEIWKSMEVREEAMEVQEEAAMWKYTGFCVFKTENAPCTILIPTCTQSVTENNQNVPPK